MKFNKFHPTRTWLPSLLPTNKNFLTTFSLCSFEFYSNAIVIQWVENTMAPTIVWWNSLSHMQNWWRLWTIWTNSYLRYTFPEWCLRVDYTIFHRVVVDWCGDAVRCRLEISTEECFFFSYFYLLLSMAKNFQMNDYVNYTSKPIANCVHFHYFVSLLLSSRRRHSGIVGCAAMAMCAEPEPEWKIERVSVVVAATTPSLCVGRKIHILLWHFFCCFCGDS